MKDGGLQGVKVSTEDEEQGCRAKDSQKPLRAHWRGLWETLGIIVTSQRCARSWPPIFKQKAKDI